jgi:hypothetical protein
MAFQVNEHGFTVLLHHGSQPFDRRQDRLRITDRMAKADREVISKGSSPKMISPDSSAEALRVGYSICSKMSPTDARHSASEAAARTPSMHSGHGGVRRQTDRPSPGMDPSRGEPLFRQGVLREEVFLDLLTFGRRDGPVVEDDLSDLAVEVLPSSTRVIASDHDPS